MDTFLNLEYINNLNVFHKIKTIFQENLERSGNFISKKIKLFKIWFQFLVLFDFYSGNSNNKSKVVDSGQWKARERE